MKLFLSKVVLKHLLTKKKKNKMSLIIDYKQGLKEKEIKNKMKK